MEPRLAQFSSAVDELARDLVAHQPDYGGLYDMLRYHLGWIDEDSAPMAAGSGKKLRPALCFLAAEAVRGDWRVAIPEATAVELVHNFSLVHDDIQDQSELRRFRKTVWSRWGVAQGINAGDALLVLAEQALIEHAPSELALPALRLLNQSCRALCEGQYLDIKWELEPGVTVDQYLAMIERKTARLFQTSAELGALAAMADADAQWLLGRFGSSLGLAFQIEDDLLGAWGPEVDTGKTAELDVATRKKTLPAVLGLAATGAAADRFRALYALDRVLTPGETAHAIGYLEELGIQERTAQIARRYRDDAMKHIADLSTHYDVEPLRELVQMTLPGVP